VWSLCTEDDISPRVLSVVVGVSLEASPEYEPMKTVQTQLSSCHAVKPAPSWTGKRSPNPPPPLTVHHSLPSSLAASAAPVGQNLAGIAITFIDISAATARSHRATETCLLISSGCARTVQTSRNVLSERNGNFLAAQLCWGPAADVRCFNGWEGTGERSLEGDGTIGAELAQTWEGVRGRCPR